MKVNNVQDIVSISMIKDIIKKSVGEGTEADYMFQVVLESLGKENKTEDIQKASRSVNYVPGTKLDSRPMVIKNEMNNELLMEIDVNKVYRYVNELTSIEKNEEISSNSGKTMDRIYSAVDKYSSQYGVDRDLVLAIIKQESNFDPNVESYAGAKGLMQLMDFNSEAYEVSNPFDIEENIRGGVRHIKEYLNMFDGNIEMALMAYNGGPGTMERRGVNSSSDLYKMPEETQNYVPKVMNYYLQGNF